MIHFVNLWTRQNEPNDGVTTYQLHKSSIIHIEFLPRDPRKLLTMGYDRYLRGSFTCDLACTFDDADAQRVPIRRLGERVVR